MDNHVVNHMVDHGMVNSCLFFKDTVVNDVNNISQWLEMDRD